MSEFRRLRMKIGDAEFEADVPESKVQPMYDRFLSVLERQRMPPSWQFEPDRVADRKSASPNQSDIDRSHRDHVDEVIRAGTAAVAAEPDQATIAQVFHLRADGAVVLKVLPAGPDQHADALLLLLYGYHRVKNEEYVMATDLNRAAEQSGISVCRLANSYAQNGRYVMRGGQRKGSHYALNSQGHEIAKEIMLKMVRRSVAEAPPSPADARAGHDGSASAPSWRLAP